MVNKIEENLRNRNFENLEKILKKKIHTNRNIDTLFEYAMVRLQFPFEDDESAIYYLNEILKLDKYNFEAMIIKFDLQNFYCSLDSDYDILISHDWKDNRKFSICDYITSWRYYDDQDMERKYLEQSIEKCEEYVWPYKHLGCIYMKKKMYKEANECLKKAKNNIISNEFSLYSPIDKISYIEEYILGTRIIKEQEQHIDELIEKTILKI